MHACVLGDQTDRVTSGIVSYKLVLGNFASDFQIKRNGHLQRASGLHIRPSCVWLPRVSRVTQQCYPQSRKNLQPPRMSWHP